MFFLVFVPFSFSPDLIWYRGLQRQVVLWDRKWAFSNMFFLVFVPFSFSPDFSSKISPHFSSKMPAIYFGSAKAGV